MTPETVYWTCIKEKKRIKKAEPFILKDIHYLYLYVLFVIKGRWLEAEPIILTNPSYSYMYALNIIKGRWREAEPVIKTFDSYWKMYCSHFKEKVKWKKGF